jgi:type IV secretory pathway protease TraF
VGHRGVRLRSAAGIAATLCGLAVLYGSAALVPPQRYEVDGLSMAPGLLPGDVVATAWCPMLDQLRRPQRHERWILAAPDGTPAIKRVVGLPGETVSIQDGDLAIGGRTVLTPPHVLAQVASSVAEASIASAADAASDDGWQRTVSMPRVLDDAACAPAERRMLLPVRDVGLAVVIRIRESPASSASAAVGVRVRVRVGGFVIPWQIKAAGRYGLVAGRLDGHLVGAVWPLEDGDGQTKHTNSCLPPLPPTTWDIAQPWPEGIGLEADAAPPSLGLRLDDAGLDATGGAGRDKADALIEQVVVWRDLLHRPAADGVVEWRLGPGAFLVLGDFPSGSRDSRQWGPLERAALRSRAMPVP